MAIFKSSVFSEIRGSIGGTTYARNKSGLYARNRSVPVNPNTLKQSMVRSQFNMAAAEFSNLPAADILAWNQFAQGYPAINKLGDPYTPTGKQVFMLSALNLMSIGLAPITSPPAGSPVIPGLDLSANTTDSTVVANAVTVLEVNSLIREVGTDVVVLQATPNLQAARQSYRNRMRQVNFNANDDLSFADEWNAYFGDPNVTIGQIVNVRVSSVRPASGLASAWQYLSIILAA